MTTPATNDAKPAAHKTALHVEGDPEIDALLTQVFVAESWIVQRTPTNASALELVTARAYNLIVTSERTTGHEDILLLREIRRIRPNSCLLILTAHGTPQDVIDAMREHAFSYFSTPFSPVSLAEMVRRINEGACWDDGIEVISATPEWLRLKARCDFKTADRLLQFLQEIAVLPEPERMEVAVALRELLYNAIEHGGQLDPTKSVELEYVRAQSMVTCRISDHGPGFDFDNIPHAAVANPPDDPVQHIGVREEKGLRPGGYGVLMARKLVDEVIYSQNGSEVLLVKYLRPRQQAQSSGLH
jgi:anti-sigma regulatory factor (Ser/Thr protein kinase)/ActR/RegA family two-component response regulator